MKIIQLLKTGGKRAKAWKNLDEAFDKSCAAWEKCIAAFERDNMVEASPLKVTFIRDTH